MGKFRPLNREQAEELRRQANEGNFGDVYVYPCALMPQDTLTVYRVGKPGSQLSKVLLDTAATMTTNGAPVVDQYGRAHASCFLTADEARSLAEALITAAEEIDSIGLSFDVPDTLKDMGFGKGTTHSEEA